jgi:dihydropteroate synthase
MAAMIPNAEASDARSLTWKAGRFTIDLGKPRVMGILNVTPDSFSDGGQHANAAQALQHAERLLQEGADIIDVGAESTRPGAKPLGPDEEWQRLAQVLPDLLTLGCPVSLDTSEPAVMQRALDLGVDVLNDVRALRRPGALEVVATHGVDRGIGICLMHMQAEPPTMQVAPHYDDVTLEVKAFLRERLAVVCAAGVSPECVVLDPGYGFGKTLAHNVSLAKSQSSLLDLGRPLLVGWSRKGSLGQLTGRSVTDRLVPSVAAALAAVSQGASVVRVHDVQATVDALKVWDALVPRSSLR